MRIIYILFILFGSTTFLFGQYVPPMFKINLSDVLKQEHSVSIQDSYLFQAAYFNERRYSYDPKKNFAYRIDNGYIYVLTGNFNPKKGDIFHLIINRKKSNEFLNIYIRVSYELSESEIIEITNLEFIEGHYWFDMCVEESQYYIKHRNFSTSTSFSGLEFGIDFKFSKEHKVSEEELNELLRR